MSSTRNISIYKSPHLNLKELKLVFSDVVMVFVSVTRGVATTLMTVEMALTKKDVFTRRVDHMNLRVIMDIAFH